MKSMKRSIRLEKCAFVEECINSLRGLLALNEHPVTMWYVVRIDWKLSSIHGNCHQYMIISDQYQIRM